MKKCDLCHKVEASNYYVNDKLVIMWVCDSCLQAELEEEKEVENV